MQQHLQMSLTLCTGTLKHMTVSRCVFKAAAQPGFPTSLTTLALNNVTLGLDQVFLALSPLKNLQVLCFCHDTYSYIPLKHLLQYSPRVFQGALPCLQKLTLSRIMAFVPHREFAELVQPNGLTVELKFFCFHAQALTLAMPRWLQMTKQQTADHGMHCTLESTHTVK